MGEQHEPLILFPSAMASIESANTAEHAEFPFWLSSANSAASATLGVAGRFNKTTSAATTTAARISNARRNFGLTNSIPIGLPSLHLCNLGILRRDNTLRHLLYLIVLRCSKSCFSN